MKLVLYRDSDTSARIVYQKSRDIDFAASNGMTIEAISFPEYVRPDILYVRGDDPDTDDLEFLFCPEEYERIDAAVREFNGPLHLELEAIGANFFKVVKAPSLHDVDPLKCGVRVTFLKNLPSVWGGGGIYFTVGYIGSMFTVPEDEIDKLFDAVYEINYDLCIKAQAKKKVVIV